ncbi:MAG: SRPBCC domain-containing protein [Bacteroidetes bacterium]|nr:SRPBCC domain-containing protein [Bacteroidota bacterium]
MANQDFTSAFLVDQTPDEAFEAINNVRGWWSEMVEGDTHQLNDEFVYRYKQLHYSKQKLIEVSAGRKVVWLVTDSSLSFVKNKSEWTGTRVSFEISEKDGKTQVLFTHLGLNPGQECFKDCSGGWTFYLKSLYKLITTGKGEPDVTYP